MRYNNDDCCSSKDPFFDVCLDLTSDKLMSEEEFENYFTYLENTESFKSSCKHLKERLDKRINEFTKFEQFLLMRLMSINMCDELYEKKKFKINFTKDNLYEGTGGGTWYYDPSKTYKDPLTNFFGTVDVNLYYSLDEVSIYYHIPEGLIRKKFHDKYYDEDENDHNYYISHLYFLYQTIKNSGIVNVLDKGNYIMFYKVDGDNIHLERTPDNDVEWSPEYFMEAFLRMYKIYING
jgi:hypothetical protein